jgi:hypothetical protein
MDASPERRWLILLLNLTIPPPLLARADEVIK